VIRAVVNSANVTGLDSGFSFNSISSTLDGDDDGSANRSVQGSLRQFMQNANAISGVQNSVFKLQSSDSSYVGGVWTIAPTSSLPTMTDIVVLDATTQAGWSGTPLVQLDGTNAGTGVYGLQITAGSSTVKGLAIGGFDGSGIRITSNGGNTIQSNYIGTDTSGTLALANINGIVIQGGGVGQQIHNNIIGGSGTNEGNLISGNTSHGIYLNWTTTNTISGNLIGVDVNGQSALGNAYGIYVEDSSSNTIGGTTAGSRNIVSGNATMGIHLGNYGANTVVGNYIGTNLAGDTAIANGIGLNIGSSNNIIGGTTAGERNVISGNTSQGIRVGGNGVSGNLIRGNYIGLNAAGTAALANGSYGISVGDNSNSNTIGGSVAGAGNVISGNSSHAIFIDTSTSNTIQGNLIGTNAADNATIANNGSGVFVAVSGSSNKIGGSQADEGNTIASAVGDGVYISNVNTVNVSVLGNSIYASSGLGIDIGNNGVNTNDVGDGDSGGNNLQNFPVITSTVVAGGQTIIAGTLNSEANKTYRIELFANSAADASGYGEGETYLGFVSVTTDGSGNASFSYTHNAALSGRISATATEDLGGGTYGSTSEFALTTSPIYTIGGTVFEDKHGNLLAGAESIGDVDNPGVANVTVLLYADGGDGMANGVDDVLMTTTTTDVNGNYSFSGNNATYWVAVDSRTIVSNSALNGGFAASDAWAEQTYGSAGSIVNGGGLLGSAGANYSGWRLEQSDDASTLPTSEHLTRVIISSGNVANINSGFSFDVITRSGDGDDDGSANRTVQGSLRQFIQNSNAISGVQTAGFRLQTSDSNYSGGVWTIRPTSELTTITDTLVLDGTNQAGFVSAPIVELAGNLAGAGSEGLKLGSGSGGSTIRGLVINRFGGEGIEVLSGANGSTIAGNYIGLGADGLTDLGNGGSGINVNNSSAIIGGTTLADRNVISGNAAAGIATNSNGQGVTILGNIIGLDATGTSAVANDYTGLSFWASSNILVGDGTDSGANWIAGNANAGILFTGPITNHVYDRNYLGFGLSGSVIGSGAWGGIVSNMVGSNVNSITIDDNRIVSNNTASGISLFNGTLDGTVNVTNNRIGLGLDGTTVLGGFGNGVNIESNITSISGSVAISGNLIAGVANDGVSIAATASAPTSTILISGNTIRNGSGDGVNISGTNIRARVTQNSIYGQTGLGIDLGNDGITTNDGTTTSGAANLLTDKPVIGTANLVANNLTLLGYVGSVAGQSTFANNEVEFFISDGSSSAGSGQTFLGSLTTDANGNFNGSLDVSGLGLTLSSRITATATDALGNTSEFSVNFEANVTPTAISDSATAVEAGGIANGTAGTDPTGNVLTNDTDPDSGDTKAVVGVAAGIQGSTSGSVGTAVAGSFGSLVINSDGSFTYTVDNNNATVQALASSSDTLQDVFTYTMADSGGLTSTTQVTLTIEGQNDNPIITIEAGDTAAESINETNGTLTSSGTLTVTDVDTTNSVTVAVSSVVASGTTTGLQANNATLLVMLTSITALTMDQSHQVVVPNLHGHGYPIDNTNTGNTAVEDGAVVTGQLAETDADTSDTHTYSLITNTAEGSVTVNSNGSYSFNPGSAFQDLAVGETRNVTFVYEVEDNNGATSQATVTITVSGTNDGPVAQSGTNTAVEDGAVVTGQLAETDADTSDTHTYSLITNTAEGSVTVNSNGSYSFNPGSAFQDLAVGETRNVTFVYEVEDNNGATSQATVTITVSGTNDGPVAQSGTNTAVEDGAVVTGQLAETDADTSDTHTYSLITNTAEGSVTVNCQRFVLVQSWLGLPRSSSRRNPQRHLRLRSRR
jgi:VCBS repeat-containing protein